MDKYYYYADENNVIMFTKKYTGIEIEITEEEFYKFSGLRDDTHILTLEDNKIIQREIEAFPLDKVKPIFNYKTFKYEESATLEEQIEYYKNLIIEKTRLLELLKASGFSGTKEEINLQTEIANLKQIYMDKNHELALQIENRLREV